MMIKKLFFLIAIFFSVNTSFAQKYFQIEGIKRIFTYYGKKQNVQINDTTNVFYYIKGNMFYIQAKVADKLPAQYVRYIILNKKCKRKITSIGRGDNTATKVRVISVNLMKAEKLNSNSQFIEQLLKASG